MFSFLYYLRVKINSILKNKLTNLILYSVIIISSFSRVSSQEIYYTIQLYYGNYLIAKEILDEFKTIYPDWKSIIIFETPNYKVQVGNFKNYYISLGKLNEIKKKYPSAFLLRLKI